MRILAIETSCDETAIALVEATGGVKNPKFKIISEVVASQIKTHRPWGGVVPMLAKREHEKNLPVVLKKSLKNEKALSKSDVIAVTVGPGLDPCLWTGIEFAKNLSKKTKKPLIGASHLEGHLYSFLLANRKKSKSKKIFPAIALMVSGGHTILLYIESMTKIKKIGETRDDAVGEAFDKVAKMMKLPYPGGPEIEKLASKGNSETVNFPRPMIYHKNYDFSFSGLKTSVLYYLRDLNKKAFSPKTKADVAASFQRAAVDVLVAKTTRAAKEFKAKSIMLSGGVAANQALRKALAAESRKLKANFFVPDFKYNTDNAVMIAVAAYMRKLQKKKLQLKSQPNLNF